MKSTFGSLYYILLILFSIGISIIDSSSLYIVLSIIIYVTFCFRTRKIQVNRLYAIFLFTCIVIFQITMYSFIENDIFNIFLTIFKLLILIIPFSIYMRYARIYLIRKLDFFNRVFQENKYLISLNTIKKLGNTIYDVSEDLNKNSSFKYINNNSISQEYFDKAYSSLDDEAIYILISFTGSEASKIIRQFTKSDYNHVSISFDSNLDTAISYNGGAKVYSPGLNNEMIEYFNKHKDANILVYKLHCSRDEKMNLINKIEEINKQGSSYNLLGLFVPYKHKDNIMYCSQFVYTMLEYSKLNYFERNSRIKPTDFIEKDYFRKLEFCYKLFLN